MKTFAVNGANDLFFGQDGNLALADGAQALAQIAAQYIKTLRGELIFDTARGTALQDTVWASSTRMAQFEASIRQRLTSVEGVSAILSLTTRREPDGAAYDATLKTIYGEVAFSDQL